jgi:hypothetical protein
MVRDSGMDERISRAWMLLIIRFLILYLMLVLMLVLVLALGLALVHFVLAFVAEVEVISDSKLWWISSSFMRE